MGRVDVAGLDELAEGVPRIVRVGSREIALVRWRGDVFALRNVCPHQTQGFQGGAVASRIEAADHPGGIRFRDDKPVLLCPRHRWEFELETGDCPLFEKVRIRTYATYIEGSRVLVDVSEKRREGAADR